MINLYKWITIESFYEKIFFIKVPNSGDKQYLLGWRYKPYTDFFTFDYFFFPPGPNYNIKETTSPVNFNVNKKIMLEELFQYFEGK